MRRDDETDYLLQRAREEATKAMSARSRGDHPAAAAAHGELAMRYQARAIVYQLMD